MQRQSGVSGRPGLGASVHDMKRRAEEGVSIVDDTWPWVSKVWSAVDSHKKKEFTSIIHGKWAHEETVATVSFAGVYLVVKDLAEAEYVCDYILNGGDKAAFMKKFDNAHSKGCSLIHISEPTRLLSISYAVFCLKKKK